MRNLLGRLNARPPEELARVAAFWRVPVAASDRRGLVGPLYRALTDPRAVRDAWDRLDGDERALVRLLAIGGWADAADAPTLVEIAARLEIAEAEARRIAVRLYHAGILAREGDDDPLPVGAVARLFLPRELALLFRRVQDEIEAGDLSGTPLRALLELLDDAELEEAAQAWGLRVIPGLRGREDLSRQLLRQVGDAGRVAAVAAKRRRDAARIWERVRGAPDGAPVPLAEAVDAAGIAIDGDDPRAGQRLRTALAELETALLVWHTYRPDGSRWLFVPAEIRSPAPPPTADLPPLTPVVAQMVEEPAWRHPDALAWDLLTLVRELAAPDAFAWSGEDEADLPRGWRRRLNARLWHRGDGAPPAGYLPFLAALGQAEGLVRHRGEGDAAVLEVTPSARRWRDRTFPEQTDRLRWWWLASADWIEGSGREAVQVWGADWRGARRRLLPRLTDLEVGVWYELDSVAARIAAAAPDLLGDTFTAATARHAGGPGDRNGASRAAAIAEVIRVELETALAWFGLVELADIPGHARAVRLTEAGAAVAREAPRPANDTPPPRPALAVSDEGEVLLRDPTPLRIWSLSAFAEPAALDRISVYRLSGEALGRALAAGFDLGQVTAFLEKQGGAPLPPEVAARLAGWARGYRRVRVQRVVRLAPDDPAALPEIERAASDAGLAVRRDGETALLVELPGVPEEGVDPAEAVVGLLRERGFAPQWVKATRGAVSGTGPDGRSRA